MLKYIVKVIVVFIRIVITIHLRALHRASYRYLGARRGGERERGRKYKE